MKKITKIMTVTVMAVSIMAGTATGVSAKTVSIQAKKNIGVTLPARTSNGISVLSTGGGSLNGVLPWYENTGTSIPEGHTPDYQSNRILEIAEPGDIIFESKGGYGVTGHCCIVEGKFFDERTQSWYVRMIESTLPGVIRGIFDGTLVNDTGARLFRVKDATKEQKQKAVEFCIRQLGGSYNLDFAHDYSEDETDWYCSELVWAAYYNQGIDIETKKGINEPGITPRDIARSEAVTEVNLY